jgi:hypothetical protein
LLGYILIFGVGVSLGLLGAGGTAIALPVLVYAVGMEAHHAVTVSLLLVGLVALFGSWLHHVRGNVRWATALSFAPPGVAGAWLGSRWSSRLSGRALLLTFSALLVIIAVRMIVERPVPSSSVRPRRVLVIAPAALVIGLLTGLLGVGGGFVIVPAMIYIGGLTMRESIGSALVVTTINSAAAFAMHVGQHPIAASETLALAGSAGAGMAAGAYLCQRTQPQRLQRWFALLLLALAAYMTARNLIQ